MSVASRLHCELVVRYGLGTDDDGDDVVHLHLLKEAKRRRGGFEGALSKKVDTSCEAKGHFW